MDYTYEEFLTFYFLYSDSWDPVEQERLSSLWLLPGSKQLTCGMPVIHTLSSSGLTMRTTLCVMRSLN